MFFFRVWVVLVFGLVVVLGVCIICLVVFICMCCLNFIGLRKMFWDINDMFKNIL